MKRLMLLMLLPALLLVCTAGAQTPPDSLSIRPDNPGPGQSITITFHPENPAFAGKTTVSGGITIFNAKGNFSVTDLNLHKSESAWTTACVIPDTATAIVVFLTDPNGKNYAALPTLLYAADGKPISEGNSAMAYAYSPAGESLFGVKQDREKADAYRQAYYDQAKDHLRTFREKVAYYSFVKDTVQLLKQLTDLPLDNAAEEQDYNVAINTAARLKNKPLSDLLINIRNRTFPSGGWKKMEFQRRLSTEKDFVSKQAILEEFKRTFPADSTPSSPYYNAMLQTMANSYALAGDLPNAIRYIPSGLHGSALAEIENNIAWYVCLKDQHLHEALGLSMASLDTLKALEATGAEKPAYETRARYEKDLENSYGTFADTYAYLLYKTGRYKEAFAYETIAMKASDDPQPDIVSRYLMMMEKVEKPSKVVASLGDYIARGRADSAMKAQYLRLYRPRGGAQAALASLEGKAQAEKQAEMVRTILNEPAAGFVLRDLDGNRVSLDSLKGKTVVLDFWATWCGPCKASFPAMQKIVDKHKADKGVVLLFIDTWENAEDKQKNAVEFIKQSPYTFHVLLDNDDQVVGRYKVEGIPTKFIIDRNGTLRFKAVGFNGNTDDTVTELESMIELAQKP